MHGSDTLRKQHPSPSMSNEGRSKICASSMKTFGPFFTISIKQKAVYIIQNMLILVILAYRIKNIVGVSATK